MDDIYSHIQNRGEIPLDEYMSLCNQAYYSTQKPFGVQGDFITAPEISQMFGEVIAAWIVDNLMQMDALDHFTLLECGPGRGTLMKDIVRIINSINDLKGNFKVIFLENSEYLRTIQKDALKGHDVAWIEDIHSPILKDIHTPVFVIANEFLDALPIKQYIFQDDHWYERCVKVIPNNSLSYSLKPQMDSIEINQKPMEGSIYEVSPAIDDFMYKISELLEEKKGGALFVDYGYAHTTFGDTFQAVKNHQYADPLQKPGEQDLTAHVNFERLRTLAIEKGLQSHGPVTQGHFLQQCGILQRTEILKQKASEEQKKDIDSDLNRLVSKNEMGQLFKVFAMITGDYKPAGFE